MKKTKRCISVLLALILAFSTVVLCAFAAGTGITEFSVVSVVGETNLEVKWWQRDGKHYLFMPSDADLSDLTAKYTASAEVFLDGEEIANGDRISLEANTSHTLTCDSNTYDLYAIKSEELPSIHITTESGSMDAVHADKSYKEPADIVISSGGEIILEKELEYIKGRGNATWTYSKKPYNIKFDKKTSLFGMDKAKKWSLLANYVDETLMRNHTALNLATQLGIPFTSQHAFVDLYINNEYYGNYIICESVEVGEGRVEISDLTDATEEANPDIDIEECELGGDHESNYKKLKADTQKWVNIPNNPEDISGGYLLEYELPNRYVDEVSGFVTKRNQTIVVKEPEYASEEQVKYISTFYQQFEDAIYSDTGYNSLGKHYSEYIDLDSIVKVYVFQEFTKNLDAGITSFFIYKDAGSDKFVAAPIWDYDMSLGEGYLRFGMDSGSPDGWWAGIIYHWAENLIKTLPTMLNALYRKDDFFAAACKEWKTNFAPMLNDEYIGKLSDFAESLAPAAVMNAIRWKTYVDVDYNTTKQLYLSDVKTKLIAFITRRKAFLDKGFDDTSVRIFFDSNGGKGNMFNESALHVNDIFTVPSCTFTYSGFVFENWNTAADGSGTTYQPGDKITLKDTKLTLYARWKVVQPKPPVEPESPVEPKPTCNHMCHQSGFMGFIWKIVQFFWKLFKMNPKCECGAAHY